MTGSHTTLNVSARTAKPGSAVNFYASATKHPVPLPPEKVNMSGKPPGEDVHSTLRKGLNHVVASTVLPIEDIFTGVETAVKSLPVNIAEEARQEW